MIYTVTLNPAIDYFLEMNKFTEGELNSLTNGYLLSGGKGINVSKVLKNFNVESIALGYIGGFTGDYIKKDILEYGLKEKFVTVEENTRINIKLKTSIAESEIAGKSPFISEEKYNEFMNIINTIKAGDILVLSGSSPSSVPQDIYARIIKLLPKGVKTILDTRGDSLSLALKEGVFLVKPNSHELEEFFQEKYTTDEEIIAAGKKMLNLGSENVLISLGKDGSILITPQGIYRGNTPKGKLVSSVGAGDSMVAGIIYGLSQGTDIVSSYKFGIASGSSTAFSKGLTTLKDMEALLEQIQITKL